MSFDDLFEEAEKTEQPQEEKPKEKPQEKKEAPKEKQPEPQPKPAEEAPTGAELSPFQAPDSGGFDDFFKTEKPQEPTEPAPQPEVVKPTEEATLPKPTIPKEEKFDDSDAVVPPKIVITDYGLKGHGKTYLAFTFPGKKLCLSFDRKSQTVAKESFPNDGNIIVKDAIRYLDQSTPEIYLESSDRTFRYLNWLLNKSKELAPDWVIIDGSEILQRICEMTMRYRNGIMPFQGIANRNLWKERRMYLNQIHNIAIQLAKRGVIYTTYTEENKVVKEGEVVTLDKIPRWIDVIMFETDVVIYCDIEQDKTGARKFVATVETSKTKTIPTGKKADITGVGIKALVGG